MVEWAKRILLYAWWKGIAHPVPFNRFPQFTFTGVTTSYLTSPPFSVLMTEAGRVRILSLPPSVVQRATPEALADMREYFDPDGVWLHATQRVISAHATCRETFDEPVVHTALPHAAANLQHHRLADVDIISVRNPTLLDDAIERLTSGAIDTVPETATYLVCPSIGVDLDTTGLEATLSHATRLVELQQSIPDHLVVLTAAEPADYNHVWRFTDEAKPVGTNEGGQDDLVSIPVYGLDAQEGYGSSRRIACLTLTAEGTVGTELVGEGRFGLRALKGIGPTTAQCLRDAGIRTVADVRATPLRELTALEGIGRQTAEQAHDHAEVIATGNPVRLTDKNLPGEGYGTPLCLDIETDSLSPTIIWQIGVYDPETDEYQAFVERNTPRDPSGVIEAFTLWYVGNHQHRNLLTWNGERFDYRHLTRFIERHVPEYAEAWREAWKHDLYKWAVRDSNALLPGRTNKLTHVARQCGYESSDTGLDGAATAAAYQRFMRTPTPANEPDWERHEAYCEDDCRALWHIYEALAESDRRTASNPTTGSKQAGLGDF